MAAQNVKQRLRMTVAYARAEEYGYAVVGASNADEIELGFTVKFGDKAADVYAIADVHKSEVRELAKELSIPADIQARTPTTTRSHSSNRNQNITTLPTPKRSARWIWARQVLTIRRLWRASLTHSAKQLITINFAFTWMM